MIKVNSIFFSNISNCRINSIFLLITYFAYLKISHYRNTYGTFIIPKIVCRNCVISSSSSFINFTISSYNIIVANISPSSCEGVIIIH